METKTSFKMEDFVLGKKFYRFIDEDHYEIYVVVHKFKNKVVLYEITGESPEEMVYTVDEFNGMGFVELIGINKDDIIMQLCLIRKKPEMFIEPCLCCGLENVAISMPTTSARNVPKKLLSCFASKQDVISFKFEMYIYETKSNLKKILSKVLSYILNKPYDVDENTISDIWKFYYSVTGIFGDDSFWYDIVTIQLSKLLNNDDKVEEEHLMNYFVTKYSTYIESYEVFQFEEYIDTSNIKMKYKIIYSIVDDKFYIVVYKEMNVVDRLSHQYDTDPEVKDMMDFILGGKL